MDEFLNREHRFWFGILNLVMAVIFLGAGTVFLVFGLGSQSAVVSVLAYAATAFFDINGLAFLVNGVYQVWKAL